MANPMYRQIAEDLTVTILPADRNQFIVNVGDVPQTPPA